VRRDEAPPEQVPSRDQSRSVGRDEKVDREPFSDKELQLELYLLLHFIILYQYLELLL
jgi:hypothetical protein